MAAHDGPLIGGNTLTVDTTAGGVVVAAAANYARTVIVQNIDATNPIFIGGSSGLTADNGYRIAAGESFPVDLAPLVVLHAISAGSVEARFLILEVAGAF